MADQIAKIRPEARTLHSEMPCWFAFPQSIEVAGVAHIGAVRSCTVPRDMYDQPLAAIFNQITPGGHVVSEGTDGQHHVVFRSFSDDHNNQSYVMEAGKPPIVFITEHNGNTYVSFRRGTTPGDLTTLGPEQRIQFTGRISYTQTWVHDDRIWLITRESGGDNNLAPVRYWTACVSDDWGESWSTPRRLVDYLDPAPESDSHRGYVISAPYGDGRLLCASSGHPVYVDRQSVWAFTIDMETGAMAHMDGTVIGNALTGAELPLWPEDLDLVQANPNHHAWITDIGPHGIAWSRWGDGESEYLDGGGYWHGRYEGDEWKITEICPSGGLFPNRNVPRSDPERPETGPQSYRGGIAFDANGDVWLSRRTPGPPDVWSIERWTRTGETWGHAETLASSDTLRLVRPQVPHGRTTGPRVAWSTVWEYTSPGLYIARPDWEGNPASPTQQAAP